MTERRKIVIPVSAKPETPHFDAEETLLSARPVVPITHAQVSEDFNFAPRPSRRPFYRGSLFLSLIVMAAVGIGVAAGLGIARYRYLQGAPAPVAAQPMQQQAPAQTDARTATVQPAGDNQQSQETVPALPDVKTEDETTDTDGRTTSDDNAQVVTPGDSAKTSRASEDKETVDRDEDAAKTSTPGASRDRKRTAETEETGDAPRAQRRERRTRDREEETIDIPRRVERASEQINRIREIFEGRQQP